MTLGETKSADEVFETVWIFHGDSARHAAGVFRTEAEARTWITLHSLTGLLTEYPVGDGCYDIALRKGFKPKRDYHGTPEHVACFSPGDTRHFHFKDGSDG